jgi:hypothetical protein
MSSTTEVRTFSDIYTEILNKMRQPTNITSIIEQAKRYANTGLHDMVFGFEYQLPWLERDAVLLTRAAYTTGTVSIDRGSTTLTGASTLWTTTDDFSIANARASGKISFGDGNVYGIDEVASATSITLLTRYVEDDDLAAGASYTYFEDEYALASDFLKPIDYRRFTAAYNIPLIGRNEFRRMYPRPNMGGTPRVATLIDKTFGASTTPVTHVQFYPYPTTVMQIPYSYITKNLAVSSAGVEQVSMSADSDEPILPNQYRKAIVSFAIWQWYRDKKDDTRADAAHADYIDDVARIVNDRNIGAPTTARLQPRVQGFRVYNGSAGRRFSHNNSFDEFRS